MGERLRDVLAAKHLLLVLDNFEHLAAAGPAVGELLATAPELTVLATSRMPLRLRAEREYAVPPLGLPRRKPAPPPEQLSQFEAVRLFIERAQAVRSDFTIDNETAPAVAEICWRLDGLPLAIELAAARVRMLSPQAMLARLEQRLPMLTSGARDAPERQRTLRNTIAWSYDLLQPEDQILFRRLAVFAGGATFEAIEAVVNPDGSLDVFGGLERLLEQSLLRQEVGPDGEPRFSMLETIREFGLEQLEVNGEEEAVRECHAAFYLALGEQVEPELIGPKQATWLDRLETEHDNLRAVLGWALARDVEAALRLASALTVFWLYRGHLSEGRAWLDRTLEVSGEPGPLHAGALLGAGLLAGHLGDYRRAAAVQETCLELARKFQVRRLEALALIELGFLALQKGDSARAIGLTESSLAVWRELGEAWGTALALNNLGYTAYLQRDFQRATVMLDEALALGREAGDRMVLGVTLDSLGALAETRGELGRATVRYREALLLAQELGDPLHVAMAVRALAGVAARSGHFVSAARIWGADYRLVEVIGEPLPVEEQARYEGAIASAREQLGEESFSVAFEEGRALPLDAAVSEALALADEIVRDANNVGLANSITETSRAPGQY